MKRQLLGGLTVAAVTSALLISTPLGAGAAAPGKARPDARASARATAHAVIAKRLPALKLGPDDVVGRPRVWSGGQGLQYVAFERSYRGLPVIGGDFVVVTDARGRLLDTSVAQTRAVSLASTRPTVGRARARTVARHLVDRVASVSTPRLVVLQRGRSALAWETQVRGTLRHEPSWQRAYVSARTGGLLATREQIARGTGTAAYSGPNPVSISTSSGYSMTDPSATTLKCQDAATNATFTGADDVWGNGNATNKETGCVDAFYAAQQLKGMLSSWLGRNGMNGSGGWVPIRVGLDDVNAYYDGTQVQIGHSQTGGRWIGSIDVVAHEFGHGVDHKTPGGISANGTQEFVADTFGAATEFYDDQPAAYDAPDWTVGEEVDLVGSGPIRDMADPTDVGDAACYSSSIPGGEVHASAGPGDHWFYLLAQGGTSACTGAAVTGIGVQAAMKVMYNAMLMKTSSSSYLKYRTWTLTAAKNLDPTCAQYAAVKAAWNAVNVPAQSADPTCSTSSAVTVANPGAQTGTVGTALSVQLTASPAGTYTWTATSLPAGLTLNASTGRISGTPTAAGTVTSTVTATGSGGQTGSATFTWTISGSGGGSCTAGQRLANPGFESGATGWTASSGVITNSASRPARTGSYYAWLDGYGSTHTDTLSQSVTIPSGCSATLSFYLRINTAEGTSTTAYDKLTVKVGSTTLATYSNLDATGGYVLRSIGLSSYAGQTVTVSFTGVEDSSLQTSFVIDDTALTVS